MALTASGTTARQDQGGASAPDAPRRPKRTVRLTSRRPLGAARLLGPVVVLVVWQVASSTGLLDPRQLAAPSTALRTGAQMFADGELVGHLLASARRAGTALACGVLLGTVLALLSGLSRAGEAAVDGLVQIKRAIPTLALIPLAILWLGIGETMKITLITLSVLVPVYINTHAALRGIDYRYVELAFTVHLSRWQFIRRVALPGALPGFFTGLRLAVTMSWTALVVLEQINATEGIGYVMTKARDYGQTDIIVVGLVIYATMGLLSDGLVRVAERRALSWRTSLGA